MTKKKKLKRTSSEKSTIEKPAKQADASEGNPPLWRALAGEPVALGLGLFVLLRPWRDGLTFPSFNAYFTALILVLGALWCARAIVRGEGLRRPAPQGLLAGFLLAAWLGGYFTSAYDPTLRGLHQVVVNLVLLVLAANALRSRLALNIVFVAIGATWTANALWTIFHYYVMLRGMRSALIDNPAVMWHYFGTFELSPELKNRLESNRAFGTFLFPNALGAFMIMGIPFFVAHLGVALDHARRLRDVITKGPVPNTDPWGHWKAFGCALGTFTVLLVVLYQANDYIGTARPDGGAWVKGAYFPFLVYGLPLVPVGLAVGWVVNRYGAGFYGKALAGVGIFVGLAASVMALWLSYSRGAMLALAASATVAVVAWAWPRLRPIRGAAAATLAMVLTTSIFLWPTQAGGQDEPKFLEPPLVRTDLSYVTYIDERYRKSMHTLDIEGQKRHFGDLTRPETFELRITYWEVGMSMALDNFWTGVGLGNFKTLYPKYQFLGAGDVETAHNDFLQAFVETGVFGGALFLAFWVYFGVWGFRRITRESDPGRRTILAGLYACVLGIAVHSLVDFDLQNPGLSAIAYLMAGLFFAYSFDSDEEPADAKTSGKRYGRAVAAALAAVILITTGSALRVYLFDFGLTEGPLGWRIYYVGDRKIFRHRMQAAERLIHDLRTDEFTPDKPLYLALQRAQLVMPELTELEAVGTLRVPMADSPGRMRRIKPTESIPQNAYFFVRDVPATHRLAVRGAERRIETLAEMDGLYPHDAELAAHLFTWYDLLFNNVSDQAARRRYAIEAERWAKEAVSRSPDVSWWRLNYAKSLWMRGAIEGGVAGLDYYYEGLEQYRLAAEYYPKSGVVAAKYGEALQKLGRALANAGRRDEGDGLVAQGQEVMQRADLLDRYTQLMNMNM